MSLDFSLEIIAPTYIYDGNMTHNVAPMWRKAGVYNALYNSEGQLAKDILEELKKGKEEMLAFPEEYKKLNPENGWGDYDSSLNFLNTIIMACEKWPHGIIHISK